MGSWIRLLALLSNSNFILILIGQIVIACGQPFFFNTIAALSNAWFGESERVMASTTLSNAIAVGNLIASLIPGLVFA